MESVDGSSFGNVCKYFSNWHTQSTQSTLLTHPTPAPRQIKTNWWHSISHSPAIHCCSTIQTRHVDDKYYFTKYKIGLWKLIGQNQSESHIFEWKQKQDKILCTLFLSFVICMILEHCEHQWEGKEKKTIKENLGWIHLCVIIRY